MSFIALLYLLCLWTSATTIRVDNGTTAARATVNDNSSQLLPAKERLKRLIPYMTFYLTPTGGHHNRPPLQGRPVLAVPAKDGYLQFPQQSPPPSYLVPVVVQPQTYHRQSLSNYPRFLLQQPSPLTKMITQNYLAIAKQQIGNTNNGHTGRGHTRINSYSPQYKHLAVDHTVYKQQQYNEPPTPIIYKQQEQQEPATYKQPQQHVKLQEPPLTYDGQQIVEEEGIIYKTQANELSDRGALYKTAEQPLQQELPPKVLPEEIQPDILTQFKAQDAILPPIQYKKLLPPQDVPKQYYLYRRPSALYLQQQQQQQQPSSQQQYKGSPDDSVTITQSQEIDVSTLPQKYHAKYLAPKPAPATISSEQYPVSYQQQEEYDTLPLIQHHNDDGILGSREENVAEQTRVEDIDGELNNLLSSVSLSKSLPDKITPENLDSSIKTLSKLLRILQRANALPHSAKTLVSNLPRPKEHPFTAKVNKLAQKIPPTDQEGSTPGLAGIDYPAYDEIPHTLFSCKKQRYKGFFGDPETGCQVWHYCDLNGGQASFLCPNGTIFSQVALTCDWWFNVKCAATSQLYVLNERLYKYILPQKLSFPEDFQGPLVDQYLALKFKEIEEKNKNKTESATTSSKPKESEEELPFSEDTATSLNKVRSIPKD